MRRYLILLSVVLLGCVDSLGLDDPDWRTPGPVPDLAGNPTPATVGPYLLVGFARFRLHQDAPPDLGVHVRLHNVTGDTVSRAGWCVAQVRGAREAGGAPVWRYPAEVPEVCPDTDHDAPLQPGSWGWIRSDAVGLPSVADILGDSLPGAWYDLDVLVRTPEDTVTVSVGPRPVWPTAGPPIQDPERLWWGADLAMEDSSPQRVVARVAAMNPTERYAVLEYGACSFTLLAYGGSSTALAPVWRSDRRVRACILIGYTATLGPGEALVPRGFGASVPVHEILGDSLPDGRYHFRAILSAGRGSVHLDLGDLHLRRESRPVPTEREVDGIHYRLTTRTGTADTLSLILDVTNRAAFPRHVRGRDPDQCGGRVYGYRDEAQRRQWFLGPYHWRDPGCGIRVPPSWIPPGETKRFTMSIPPMVARGIARPPYLLMHFDLLHVPFEDWHRFVLAPASPAPGP